MHAALRWSALVMVVAVLALVAYFALGAERGAALQQLLPATLAAAAPEEKPLGQLILASYAEFRANARNWSFVHFGAVFLSAALAAFAGVLLKIGILKSPQREDVAAVLAMLSALLVTLSTLGDFRQKWSANRLAAARMEALGFEFMGPERTRHLVRMWEDARRIANERNEQIVGPVKPPGG